MRKIYIAVLSVLGIGIFLFIASFTYLDFVNHKTFHYIINLAGRDVGTIRIDRFETEDKILYKSVTNVPFDPLYTEYRSRLVLDKKYNLENYTKERIAGRATDVLYVEHFKSLLSFVSRYQSKFSCLDNIAIRRGTFVFEEDSPVTYIPMIENYDFSKGRSQGFNAVSSFQAWNLPPLKRFITFTSIRDEYIKVGSKKIKTENLIIKIRDYPQGMLWVAKSDRTIIRLEIPSKSLTITRTFKPKAIIAQEHIIKPIGYLSKEVVFKGSRGDISGTITYPSDTARFPAIVLIPGSGPQDRQYQGLFASLADHLSKKGFAVLRFDKRGVGSTDGDLASSTDNDDMDDSGSAIQYMSEQGFADPRKVFLIGHGRGAARSLKLAAKNSDIRGLVLMAPSLPVGQDDNTNKDSPQAGSQPARWTEDYINLVTRSERETQAKVASTEGEWVYIFGKKCFLADAKEDLSDKPLSSVKGLTIPVLILQGKEIEDPGTDIAALVDKAFQDSGNTAHTLTYYAYLGNFFGKKIYDETHRCYYETDKEVLDNITNWLTDANSKPAPSDTIKLTV